MAALRDPSSRHGPRSEHRRSLRSDHESELRPAFDGRAARAICGAAACSIRPIRAATIRARFLAMRPARPLTIRQSEDAFVDELFAAWPPARRAAAAGPLSARLSRRQPRALGARSAHVRRPLPAFANTARCASPAGSARSRASSARPGDLRASGCRVEEAHRASRALQALSRGAARLLGRRAIASSAWRCWSIATRCRRPRGHRPLTRATGEGRHRAGRSLRHELRAI